MGLLETISGWPLAVLLCPLRLSNHEEIGAELVP
jgi:hypothetical protein